MSIPGVNKAFIKVQIDSVRQTIGRTVTVYTQHLSACTLCAASGYLDTFSNTSWYVTCPICSGSYWLNTATATEVLARVHWVSNEGITATPGGKYYLGDAQITVDPSYTELLEAAQNQAGKVVVDGQDFQILKINPLGAPEINRVRAILKGMGDRPDHG